jgi:hypothetical protein
MHQQTRRHNLGQLPYNPSIWQQLLHCPLICDFEQLHRMASVIPVNRLGAAVIGVCNAEYLPWHR